MSSEEKGFIGLKWKQLFSNEDLRISIPKEVEEDAERIAKEKQADWQNEIARRKDFRDTLTFTIDPADAKDFDDALSFKTSRWKVRNWCSYCRCIALR